MRKIANAPSLLSPFTAPASAPKKLNMRYLIILLVLPLLAACTSSRYASPERSGDVAQVQAEFGEDIVHTPDRKVLYAANLTVVVAEPDSAVARTVALAKNYGGFMSSTSSASARIRVPADRFEAAMVEIETFGKLRAKYVSGDDVTDQYLDLGIRLDNAEKSRARYLELLARAETVEAALAVERELERLNEVIDRYKGQRQRMDQLERFSTIDVTFPQKAKLGPLGVVFKGLYSGVRWLFVRK